MTREEIENELNKHESDKNKIEIDINENCDSQVYKVLNDWKDLIEETKTNKDLDENEHKSLISKINKASNTINEHNRKSEGNWIFPAGLTRDIGGTEFTLVFQNPLDLIKKEESISKPKIAEIHTEEKKYIVCPYCGDDKSFSVNHILDGTCKNFGTWYCDSCGGGINGKLNSDDVIEIEFSEQKIFHTYDLLKYYKDEEEFFIIVPGISHSKDIFDGKEYFYGEHTCPKNYLRVEKVISEDDADPHGIFQYISSIPKTKENQEFIDANCDVKQLIKLFKDYYSKNIIFNCTDCPAAFREKDILTCFHEDVTIDGIPLYDNKISPDWCPRKKLKLK